VEQEYFLDYEKLTNHTDENFLDDFEDDDDELDRNDILLPWLVTLVPRDNPGGNPAQSVARICINKTR